MKRLRFLALTLLLLAVSAHGADWLSFTSAPTTRPLVQAGRAAPLVLGAADAEVVRVAAADLARDIASVTGVAPAVTSHVPPDAEVIILVGTLGQHPLIDALVADHRIDVAGLAGAWESFVITTVDTPFLGVKSALVIVGSDRRGTAYGLYELAQAAGVSPWHWWADVTPEKHPELHVAAGTRRFGPPSVKFRGLFINDEDWGLKPWAARTHEPESGNLGPKTYGRVFELLLRLKANTLWPGMHPGTRPFNALPENAALADRYAIVMGSSHAEPLLRNNVGEWTAPAKDYNYLTNREGVHAYWSERMKTNGRFENLYTLGMRGIHDSNMQGPKTDPERIAALERIFADQRALLATYARDGAAAPQIFCAYKEVLDLYRRGLRVPDDVTLVWPDDNFGYIRNFTPAQDRARSGGFGVYYHASYLGRPLAYLWLNTTPPALIWSEMRRAYDHGADRVWILNIGDIKPGELAAEFFLQLAWNVDQWTPATLGTFLPSWAAREFGAAHAAEIAAILAEHFRLSFIRKPEHLQWWLPGEAVRPSPFTASEAADRLAAYAHLAARVDALAQRLPAAKQDAFFELVTYPVVGAARANQRYFHAEAYARYFDHHPEIAARHAGRAIAADAELQSLTRRFNEDIAGGKWRHLIALEPADNQWRSMRIAPLPIPAANLAPADPSLNSAQYPMPNDTPAAPAPVLDLAAGLFAQQTPAADGARWTTVPGLGRTGAAITVWPTTAAAGNDAGAAVTYPFTVPQPGDYEIVIRILPTHPVVSGQASRLGLQVDALQQRTLTNPVIDGSAAWAQSVLNNTIELTTLVTLATPGAHTITLRQIDAGVVVDQLLVRVAPTATAPQR